MENPPEAGIERMRERYEPDQLRIIDQGISDLRLTRKRGVIAPTVLLKLWDSWERFPPDQVTAGHRTYVEKRYALEGKKEEYLLGIIRNASTNGGPSSKTRVPHPSREDVLRLYGGQDD